MLHHNSNFQTFAPNKTGIHQGQIIKEVSWSNCHDKNSPSNKNFNLQIMFE